MLPMSLPADRQGVEGTRFDGRVGSRAQPCRHMNSSSDDRVERKGCRALSIGDHLYADPVLTLAYKVDAFLAIYSAGQAPVDAVSTFAALHRRSLVHGRRRDGF